MPVDLFPFKLNVQFLFEFHTETKQWISHSDSKTEILVFGNPFDVTALGIMPKKNLGVVLDSSFKFDKQISSVVEIKLFSVGSA